MSADGEPEAPGVDVELPRRRRVEMPAAAEVAAGGTSPRATGAASCGVGRNPVRTSANSSRVAHSPTPAPGGADRRPARVDLRLRQEHGRRHLTDERGLAQYVHLDADRAVGRRAGAASRSADLGLHHHQHPADRRHVVEQVGHERRRHVVRQVGHEHRPVAVRAGAQSTATSAWITSTLAGSVSRSTAVRPASTSMAVTSRPSRPARASARPARLRSRPRGHRRRPRPGGRCAGPCSGRRRSSARAIASGPGHGGGGARWPGEGRASRRRPLPGDADRDRLVGQIGQLEEAVVVEDERSTITGRRR